MHEAHIPSYTAQHEQLFYVFLFWMNLTLRWFQRTDKTKPNSGWHCRNNRESNWVRFKMEIVELGGRSFQKTWRLEDGLWRLTTAGNPLLFKTLGSPYLSVSFTSVVELIFHTLQDSLPSRSLLVPSFHIGNILISVPSQVHVRITD